MRRILVIVAAVLAASCAVRPAVSARVAGEPAPLALASETQRSCTSAQHGDAFPRDIPLTTVRTAVPLEIEVRAPGATAIRGWLYDEDAPSPGGGPLEEFAFAGDGGTYSPRAVVAGRSYRVLVNARSDGLLTGSEVTYLFLFRIAT